MIERKYRFSGAGEVRAEESGLSEALDENITDAVLGVVQGWRSLHSGTDPTTELVTETLQSTYFQDLNEEEQLEILRTINRFSQTDRLAWLVEGTKRDQDDLLHLPKPEARHQALPEDLVTLIGASALDFYDARGENWLDNWQINGFGGRLDAAVFATAAAFRKNEELANEPGCMLSFGISDYTRRNIFLGGSMHGDFIMRQFDTHTHGSLSPTGRHVEFAPVFREVTMRAYHSSEADIAIDTLIHLGLAYGEGLELRQLLESVNTQIKEDDSPSFLGNFGDYGDAYIDELISNFQCCRRQWQADFIPPSENGVELNRLIVDPSDHSVSFKIVSLPEYLRFMQSTDTKNDGETERHIDIPNKRLGDFLIALHKQAKSGAGRTAPEAIEALVNAAIADMKV